MRTRVPEVAAAIRNILAAAAFSLIGLSSASAAPDTAEGPREDKSTLARVISAWKARQERVKSFHFTWKTRIEVMRGLPAPVTPLLAGLQLNGGQLNAADVEYTIPQSECWGEGPDRLRDEFFMATKKGDNDPGRTVRVRNLLDGAAHARVILPLFPTETPVMTVWRNFSDYDLADQPGDGSGAFSCKHREIDLIPLLVALRPLSQASGMIPAACHVVGENVTVENVPCIKLQVDHVQTVQQRRIPRKAPRNDVNSDAWWVDPRRDYAVVLWERRRPQEPSVSIKIEYKRNRNHGWIPSSWHQSFVGMRDGGTLDATVTQSTINEALPGDTFAHTGPAGAQICDVTVDEKMSQALTAESENPSRAVGVSMDAIVAAWTRRQAKIRSFQFTWQSEWTKAYREAANMPAKRAVLPEFQSFKSKNNQWLDADRLAVDQILLESPKPSPVVQIVKAAYDGHSTRTYFADDFLKIGVGQVKPGFDEDLADRADVRPLLLALRPSEPRLSRIEPSTCRVLPITCRIDNESCTIVCSDNSPGHQVFYWLDPAHDYIVLREYHTVNGQDSSRIDISYRSDPTYGSIPDGWHRNNVGDGGGFRDLTTSKVIGYKINTPLPASAFKLEFPKGTETADLTDSPREIARPQPRRPPAGKLP